MVDVTKIRIGETYTYRQLCKLFNEKQEGGNSKKSQLKKWAQHFKWSNSTTQKYLIIEIYSEIQPFEDNRKNNGGNNTGKFTSIDDMIMLSFDEVEEIKTTLPRLAVLIGILSEQYNTHRFDYSEFCNNNGYSHEFVSEYFSNIESCVLRAIKRSINRLKNEGFIEADSYYVLVLENGSTEKLSIEAMKYFETEIERLTKTKKYTIRNSPQFSEFSRNVISLINQMLGISVRYYYREYSLRKTSFEYSIKTNRDYSRLTRSFLITICYNMIKKIYRMANRVYVDDPKSGITYLVSEDYTDSEITKMIRDVIDLSNYFFVYMYRPKWNDYWNENELKDNNRDNVFMATILFELLSQQLEQKNTKPTSTSVNPTTNGKELVAEEPGLDIVEEIEQIISDMEMDKNQFGNNA